MQPFKTFDAITSFVSVITSHHHLCSLNNKMHIEAKVLLRGSLVKRSKRHGHGARTQTRSVSQEDGDSDSASLKDLEVEIQYQHKSLARRKRVSFQNDKDDNKSDVSRLSDPWFHLHEEFPSATRAECKRFWDYHKDDARERLKDYLEWRKLHGLDSENLSRGRTFTASQQDRLTDKKDWEDAWAKTWEHAEQSISMFPDDNTTTKHTKHDKVYKKCQIPQYLFAYNPSSCTPALQVLPAQIDANAASPEHHALAVALYLDRKFQRHLEDVGNLWLDVRGAPGWPNPPPFQLIPLTQAMAHHLLRLYPERLHQLIIFPLPKWAVAIWKVISKLLPAVVTERTVLISGSDKHTVPLDVAKTAEKGGVPEEIVDDMERTRNQAMLLKSPS